MATRKKSTKKTAAKPATKRAPKNPKYIFIVGGVMSGVGKGVASSSIATCLQARGLNVTAIAIEMNTAAMRNGNNELRFWATSARK